METRRDPVEPSSWLEHINWPTALFLTITPVAALVWGCLHVQAAGLRTSEILFLLASGTATALSITAGYHRLFAHRAYECNRFVKLMFVMVGSAAFQHSVLSWASDHRRHHKNIDQEGDPYNIQRGFLWAHIGWLFFLDHKREDYTNIPDLLDDPLLRFQDRYYVPIAIAVGFGLPLAVGFAVGNPWGCLLWAGLVRVVAVHHSTFLVNSLAHTLGRRPYTLRVSARDSFVTAILTFGEGYHNFHHRFAADYRNGVRRHAYDPTKWLIRALASIGWAWDLRRVPRERIIAAEMACDSQRLTHRLRGCSEHVIAALRDRMAEIHAHVERAATRLGEIENQVASARAQFAAARKEWRGHLREVRHEQLARFRDQLESLREAQRRARQDLHAARSTWRQALTEFANSPLAALAPS